jgi:D-beta-D-heptose 7-phosphate kinase/D-beta-D-heptose 1-phosphate adenosyltransferase
MLGGAGNVARNVEALGAQCILLAVVGEGAAGAAVASHCAEAAGIEPRLVVEPGRPTTVKSRYVAAGQQLLRVDDETDEAISEISEAALLAAFEAAIGQVDVVVLADYGKGVLAPALLRRVIEGAGAASKPVIVDPKGRDYSRFAGAALLKPNRIELEEESGRDCSDDDGVVAAARQVLAASGVERMLVSRSEKGMSLIGVEGTPLHLPVRAQQVADVSGAGDTVIATAAVALAAGADMETAAALSNLAGGIVVAKRGTAVVTAGELERVVNEAALGHPESKVMDLDQLELQLGRWRAAGLSSAFTNGCFDLLHPGHVALLADARRRCDRLIVAINSDASVRRLKGPERPVQTAAARAEVLAALAAVDAVVVFEEDTPIALLERLRPDLLMKGGDYDLDGVVGADLVRGYGGEVRIFPSVAGAGTSELIGRGRRKRSP